MGEKERGKPDRAQEPPLQSSTSASQTTSSMSICSMANHHTAAPINGLVVRPNSNGKPEDPARPAAFDWQTAWRFIYEKWRLCAFIALAVVVSRFSTMG
jgi:ubiquitin-conjugating enzyme E2 J2